MSLTVRPTAYEVRANTSASMQILRHSQIAIAMEIYSEVPSAKIRGTLKRLGRLKSFRHVGRSYRS
jgi:hypothetical protein